MITDQRYRCTSHRLFDQAMAALEAGDLQQASEKRWGATAQALKSVAERRGWKHNSHAHFYSIVRYIADELEDENIRRCFDAANSLHSNFYENWMTLADIRPRANDVQLLIERLAHLE